MNPPKVKENKDALQIRRLERNEWKLRRNIANDINSVQQCITVPRKPMNWRQIINKKKVSSYCSNVSDLINNTMFTVKINTFKTNCVKDKKIDAQNECTMQQNGSENENTNEIKEPKFKKKKIESQPLSNCAVQAVKVEYKDSQINANVSMTIDNKAIKMKITKAKDEHPKELAIHVMNEIMPHLKTLSSTSGLTSIVCIEIGEEGPSLTP